MPEAPLKILIVDDEKDVREPIATYLSAEGYDTDNADCAESAVLLLKKRSFDIIITDVQMPGMTGLELLSYVKVHHAQTAVIIFTAFGTVETAISALKSGAADYLLKPVHFEDIRAKIDRVAEKTLQRNLDKGSKAPSTAAGHAIESILGKSPLITELKSMIRRVAKAGSFVVLQGDSGTGKELAAQALHEESSRRLKPFIAINCAAIPEQLVESEFFGYVKGAFTGADTDKKGLLDSADGGTLFLDEIADLPLAMQAKLLRALELREVTPVGSTHPHAVDLTVISACGRDLRQSVIEGRFRSDLYYRLNVIEIKLPPLCDRDGDIQILAQHFLRDTNKRLGTQVSEISEDALQTLDNYEWPGNVRELRNVIERAVVMSTTHRIEITSLPEQIQDNKAVVRKKVGFRDAVKEFEQKMIIKTLDSCGGDKKLAAEMLGIGLSTLYRMLDDFKDEQQ